ncbi:hypothetical protein HGP14_32690 [Rhizobium sp. P32RR-XVIII]|uniref:hypothetical protein n=1 Tax=Rhizobium sp. P32RR-XVIII TaxID=2726738 RepID=UPI0014568004|nr:hypothetical protein [Rhizobium sp. P32RR-XVIII]NLS07977.1 hypothetical protein [Rhizobium sp. P32RR-XVIII]
MSDTETFTIRWRNYKPTKTLWVWSMIGVSVLTMVLGFTMGGWTTGGRASVMASNAAKQATSELVASMCVQNFVTGTDAAKNLAALKETSSWQRNDFIEKGGWMTIAGLDEKVDGAADLCAETLADMKELPAATAEAL